MEVNTRRLTPMVFVADVGRSIAFYGRLGFSVGNTFAPPDAEAPTWAWLVCGDAHLMIVKATEPLNPQQQAILFYLYVDDVAAAHESLSAARIQVGAIATPFYAPHGEFRVVDPDGYCLMVTHV